MNDALLFVLLQWASWLSGYSMPDTLPEVQYKNHAWFVAKVCDGYECDTLAAYEKGIVYLDKQFDTKKVEDFTKGIIVHELVHYLRHKYDSVFEFTCMEAAVREREAYRIQREFMTTMYSWEGEIPTVVEPCGFTITL